MRIYAVADIHSRPSRLEMIAANIADLHPDVLVVAGDIISYVKSAAVYEKLNALAVPVLVVRGNTDPFWQERSYRDYANIRSLDMRKLNLEGFSFFGISGTIPVPFRNRLRLFERFMLDRAKRVIDRNTILVAHPPPWGVLDRVMGRFRAGSKGVAEILFDCRPPVMICGHIHEASGVECMHETLVVNCSIGRGCQGAVIELSEGIPARAHMV